MECYSRKLEVVAKEPTALSSCIARIAEGLCTGDTKCVRHSAYTWFIASIRDCVFSLSLSLSGWPLQQRVQPHIRYTAVADVTCSSPGELVDIVDEIYSIVKNKCRDTSIVLELGSTS